jgi:predicted nucleic-acid-binding protein
LRSKAGDKLDYELEGDHVTLRVHLDTRSLKGVLASKKGKGMSFAQIREAAANAVRGREHAVSKRRLVDTNLIVRYLVQDHEKHAKAAEKLFDSCDRGDLVLEVLPVVLAECVFVLESFHEHARGDASVLGRLISNPAIEISRAAIHRMPWIAIEEQSAISRTV